MFMLVAPEHPMQKVLCATCWRQVEGLGGPSIGLAVLKAKIKVKSIVGPPPRIRLGKMAVRTLPRDPPGEGGPRSKAKIILSTAGRKRRP
jgi:hypothetical protein